MIVCIAAHGILQTPEGGTSFVKLAERPDMLTKRKQQ
jgi:hypothetical protein